MVSLRLLAIATGLLFCACTESDPCDSTTHYDRGVCRLNAAEAGAVTTNASDAGADAAGPTFGTVCMDGVNHSDCQGAVVNACLIQPGLTAGFCSYVGCNTNPICPAGWTCFDLSQFQPGAPWGCVKF